MKFTAEQSARYRAATHAMQSGVAQDIVDNPERETPKHLRVGVNNALVETSVLAQLMFDKGIITETEYAEALIAGMEAEVKRYADMLSERHGVQITLG